MTDPVTAAGHPLFANGGELGRAMDALDWSRTDLGAPDTWPGALRNAVRIVLTSRFSMWMAWGPELSFFYNDAYLRDTLQGKHPWALGRPAHEVWAEIWHDIGPRIRTVLDTGVATWDEDLLLFLERSGYPEETYHTFSYSPLEEDGRTAGMLCVVAETTERVVGERRVAHLRELATVATDRSRDEVLAAVAAQLERNPADLPFCLLYVPDDEGGARLGGSAGVAPGSPAAPEVVGDDAPWPVARALAGEWVLVEDPDVPDLPTGAWHRPPRQVVVAPLATAAADRGSTAGALVVGLNPHRRYDERYRGFVELVANSIASVLASAAGYEAERRRAEELAELDRAKTDFFSNVSHEFRTPLTLIAGPVEELRGAPAVQADPRLREEVDVVARNALRLGRLVNTLLDFSRLQAGRLRARFQPVDLAAATAELASVFRSAVTRAGLELTVDAPPLGEPVHVDRDLWEQVVLNLLSNALKFTLEGGITVRVRQEGAAAVVTVADTGTGIPAAELPRLFERFHRIRDVRARSGEGSGIGLAMVRELVTLHGGTITVESTPDVGTTFTITLPLGTAHLPADQVAEEAVPDAAGVSPAAQPFVAEALRWLPGGPAEVGSEIGVDEATAVVAPHPGSGRVLVADDNADMREYLVRLLSDRYEVTAVADGQEALDEALATPPDLVVSDVMMPRLDGLGLLAALRADARTARVPVVLLSARAGQEAAVEGLASGADDYLVKPFPAQELLARVSAHLQLGRARREAEARFTAMADLAPALIWVAGPAGERIYVNGGWTAFTGRPAAAETGEGWTAGLHPEDAARYRATVEQARADGHGWEVEFRLRRADGAWHWLLERAAPVGDGLEGGVPPAGWVGACTDITARYRETERQTLLAEVGAALDREAGVEPQLTRLARLLVDARVADMCTVRLVEDGGLRYVGVAALDELSETRLADLDPNAGLGPQVAATGRSVIEHDMPAAWRDREEAQAEEVDRLVLRSGLFVPLSVRGRVLAVLGLGRRADAPSFNDDDRELAEEIAGRAALAVDNTLLLAEERAGAHRLALLQRATARLSAATTPEEVAGAAAEHVRRLFGDGCEVAVYELDPAHRALSVLGSTGSDEEARNRFAAVPLHVPLPVTTAVNERRPVFVDDGAAATGLRPELAETLAAFGLAASIALPLSGAGRLVGVLGIGFRTRRRTDPAERSVLLAMAEQAGQALDRARLYRAEQDIAETLQRSLLPAELPELDRLALAARYLPGAEGTSAGGDWYDVVPLGGDRVAIAVGDVVGQGPSAAAVMGQLRSALSAALLAGATPSAALELLDRFASRLPGALASTAACLVVDPAAGSVCWARAGHPPPVVVSASGTRLLDSRDGSGTVLGAPGRAPYREGEADLEPGDTLLLYTDGLVERRGEDLDAGLERLVTAAGGLVPDAPERLTTALLHRMLAETDQPDDVAVIAARLVPAPLDRRIAADPRLLARVRRDVQAWAEAAGLPEETTEDLQLALGEAAANAVEHAYRDGGPGGCAYALRRRPDGTVEVRVTDTGHWRPEPADKGFRGRGLQLIHELGDDVTIERVEGGTTVRFTVRAEPPSGAGPAVVRRAGTGQGVAARLEVGGDDGVLRLGLPGELDLAAADALGPALLGRLAAQTPGTRVVVDLQDTTYLASSGVALLMRARAEAEARGLDLEISPGPSRLAARVLALSGLEAAGAR